MLNKHSKTQVSPAYTLNIDPPADAQEQGELYSCYFIALKIIAQQKPYVNRFFLYLQRISGFFCLLSYYHKTSLKAIIFLVINMEIIAKNISIACKKETEK